MIPITRKRHSASTLQKARWFTIVELIVVITVLAILGTIGFLSIGAYSSNARDSQRISDMTNLAKSLDASSISVGSYPAPDNSFAITYAGGPIWYQGAFSSGALAKLGGTGINKKPVDPLRQNEYAYSVLAFGKAYQLKADYEGDLSLKALDHESMLIDTAYADPGNPKVSLVKGNYGGLVARTVTGGLNYVLAIPSILTSTGTSGQSIDLSGAALSGTLLFNGKSNTAASSFNPNVVIFSGTTLPNSDTGSGITNMFALLKGAYQGSDIASLAPLQTLLATPTGWLADLGCIILTSQLWGKTCVAATPVPPPYSGPWAVATGGDCTTVSNAVGVDGNTSTCYDTRTYTMQWGATHTKVYSLIKLYGAWWFNQNLAYPPATGYQASGWTSSDLGYYSCPGISGTSTSDCGSVSTLGYLYQWSAAMAWGTSTNNQAARVQGVCPSGWGVPTKGDFTTSGSAFWSYSDGSWAGNITAWPWSRTYAGTRWMGSFSGKGTDEDYYSSYEFSSGPTNAYRLYTYSSNVAVLRDIASKGYGYSVRCIKN